MHQLRRDRRPGDHGKSNLEKISLAAFHEENAFYPERTCRFEFNPERAEKRNEFVLYAGTISGVRKEKNSSLRLVCAPLAQEILPGKMRCAEIIFLG